jgi:hypothetical protein
MSYPKRFYCVVATLRSIRPNFNILLPNNSLSFFSFFDTPLSRHLTLGTESQTKGFEQTVNHMGVSLMDGSGIEPLFYKTVKPKEIKNGSTGPIWKMVLPWGTHSRCHFWLIKKGTSKKEYNYAIISEYLFPLLMANRDKNRDGDDVISALHDRGIVLADGEDGFYEAFLDFMKTDVWKNSYFMFLKGSPNCTGVPGGNPLDNCPLFKNLKAYLKRLSNQRHVNDARRKIVREDDDIDGVAFTVLDTETFFKESLIVKELTKQLKNLHISLEHIDDLKRFFFRMSDVFAMAATQSKLSLGWFVGGYYPWNPTIPMRHCEGFNEMDPALQRDFLHRILPDLMIPEFAKEGDCKDSKMDEWGLPAGGFGVGTTVTEPFDMKTKENQRRAFIVSHEKQEERRALILSNLEKKNKNERRQLLVRCSRLKESLVVCFLHFLMRSGVLRSCVVEYWSCWMYHWMNICLLHTKM